MLCTSIPAAVRFELDALFTESLEPARDYE
jgi:hypothetical protein